MPQGPGNGNKADAEYKQGEIGRKANDDKGYDVQHHAGGEHHPPLVPEPVNQHARAHADQPAAADADAQQYSCLEGGEAEGLGDFGEEYREAQVVQMGHAMAEG